MPRHATAFCHSFVERPSYISFGQRLYQLALEVLGRESLTGSNPACYRSAWVLGRLARDLGSRAGLDLLLLCCVMKVVWTEEQ